MDHDENTVPSSNILTVDIEGLLNFFDDKPDWGVGHATGIIAIVGEDLNTACLQHYLKSQDGQAVVLRNPDTGRPWPVTTGHTKGPRLDRWIQVTWPNKPTTVFQTEIKSWSSHGFGGFRLPLSATPEEVNVHRQCRWDSLWDSGTRRLKHPRIVKVVVCMKPPKGVDPGSVRPLLIFWEALGPGEAPDNHLFRVDVADAKFPELWVFSVSNYLRSLLSEGVSSVELEMPGAALRLRALNRLFSG